MSELSREIAELEGVPRKNGELVFEAPWQGRAFGMAAALADQAHLEWAVFRQVLIEDIARAAGAAYYMTWLGALERLVLERGLVTQEELERRAHEYRSMQREDVF